MKMYFLLKQGNFPVSHLSLLECFNLLNINMAMPIKKGGKGSLETFFFVERIRCCFFVSGSCCCWGWLGGGFKYFCIFPPSWGDDQIWRAYAAYSIFLKWIETTNYPKSYFDDPKKTPLQNTGSLLLHWRVHGFLRAIHANLKGFSLWDTPYCLFALDGSEVLWASEPRKKPSYFPLYCLVNRDPYNVFFKSL